MEETFQEKATSSAYLLSRINTNKNAQNNFDHWSINQFPKLPFNATILDLGCGTGKQILSFAQFFPESCNYYGCDISQENIKEVEKNYFLPPKLTLIHQSFDSIEEFIPPSTTFDLIYSFYALYYSQDIEKLLTFIFNTLRSDGILWVVMPYKNTNKEIFSILEQIYPLPEKVIYSVDGFATDLIKFAQKAGFKTIETSIFENKIFFTSMEATLNYLQNTTFYNELYASEIKDALTHLNYDDFGVTKEVISLKFGK